MNIISLFNSFFNHLSNILDNNLFLHELEHNISISTKIKNINFNYISTSQKLETPKVLYIEADVVHANLQSKNKGTKNKIVPVILTHEEDFVKKKELKNYIASSILKNDKLWEETYKYLDAVYDLTKVDKILLSSDGGSWIKSYDIDFLNVIFVLDKFHYRKALNCIFKKEPIITKIADGYMVDVFKILANTQCQLYPEQEKEMIKKQNYLINHIDGIINQNHPDYKCPCSMEGHISNKYAKFISSRPHTYSLDGLENVTQLLTMKANNIKLTEEIYHNFKTGESVYKKINLEKFITNFRNQAKQVVDNNLKYNLQYKIDNNNFNLKDNYRTNYFLSKRM